MHSQAFYFFTIMKKTMIRFRETKVYLGKLVIMMALCKCKGTIKPNNIK